MIKKIHSKNFLFVEGSAIIRVKSKVPPVILMIFLIRNRPLLIRYNYQIKIKHIFFYLFRYFCTSQLLLHSCQPHLTMRISFDDCSIVSWKIFCHMFTSYLPNSHEICISLEAFGQVHCTCCFGVYYLQHPNADQYHWQGNFEEPNLRKGNINLFVGLTI